MIEVRTVLNPTSVFMTSGTRESEITTVGYVGVV